MRSWRQIVAVLLLLLLLPGETSSYAGFPRGSGVPVVLGTEEFAGPFLTWKNAKTDYGAVGNGTTDDTTALQNGLNGLTSTTPVLYLPCGNYKITSTVTLSAGHQYEVIGSAPSCVTISWFGSSGGTMLANYGTDYSLFSRITLDGKSSAGILVDEDWPSGNFDENNAYTDIVFKNATDRAFACGKTAGCAEIELTRDTFSGNFAAVWMGNQNALDLWVWYCLFEDNTYAVTDTIPGHSGNGQFSIYNSVFLRSSYVDVMHSNIGSYNIRNNYSNGSDYFLITGGSGGSNGHVIQNNVIVFGPWVPDGSGHTAPIWDNDAGPMLFVDNFVQQASGLGTSPVVYFGNGTLGDLLSTGNTFTAGTAGCGNLIHLNGGSVRCHSYNDTVNGAAIPPAQPTLPPTPPNLNHAIFEASTTGSGSAACTVGAPCTIQHAIDTAAASGDANPVVHIQPGIYSVTTTITMPASRRMQIVGDGWYSNPQPSTGITPLFKLAGPSLAALVNFGVGLLSGGSDLTHDLIEVDGVDASGSGGLVYADSVLFGGSKINLFVDGVNYSNIEAHDLLQFSDAAATGSATITGGAHGGKVNMYLGICSENKLCFNISGSPTVNLNGIWNEVNIANIYPLALTGNGTFSYSGSNVTVDTTVTNSVALTNFSGTAALANLIFVNTPCVTGCGTYGNYSISGSASGGNVLGLGIVGPSTTYWSDTTSPADTMEFLNSQQSGNPNSTQITEIPPSSPNTTFITNALNLMRTNQPTVPAPLAAGQTDLRLYRLGLSTGNYGLHLVP